MKVLLFLTLMIAHVHADKQLIYKAKNLGIKLDKNDKETLEIGEISTARYVTGGILGTYPLGFGIGHAVQGRWSQKGYIFTAGELISIGVLLAGASECTGDLSRGGDCSSGAGTMTIGVLGFVAFRIWEIVDVWAAPLRIEKEYRELKKMIEEKEKSKNIDVSFSPFYSPSFNTAGVGLSLKF